MCCLGDLESYREAVQRCEVQMKRVHARRAKVAVVSPALLRNISPNTLVTQHLGNLTFYMVSLHISLIMRTMVII